MGTGRGPGDRGSSGLIGSRGCLIPRHARSLWCHSRCHSAIPPGSSWSHSGSTRRARNPASGAATIEIECYAAGRTAMLSLTVGRMRDPVPVVLIAGKDPLVSIGGHGAYVRVHARALGRAGFEPHIFSVYPRREIRATDFGLLHRARSRIQPDRAWMLAAHAGPIVRQV